MDFIQRSNGKPGRIGILPGSFNPPTVAHLELIDAAGFHVDEVVCVLPRVFPHKRYFGATLEQRVDMLLHADPVLEYSMAVTDRGLFIDIAREFREHYGDRARLYFLCGADAAERIITWDYGQPGFVNEMLREFELLVARRGSDYSPPEELRDRIHALHVRGGFDQVSSTEVRERIERGQPWEHLVPQAIIEQVRTIYS